MNVKPMMWKTAAMIMACGLAEVSSTGQVYSVNQIGYLIMRHDRGFSLFSPTLGPRDGDYSVSNLFMTESLPDGLTIYKFDPIERAYEVNTFVAGVWDDPTMTIARGEGAVLYAPEEFAETFAGPIFQGDWRQEIPSGLSLQGYAIPIAGELVEELGFPIADFDTIYTYDKEQRGYTISCWHQGQWYGPKPVLNIGEGFWVLKSDPATWSFTFHVNQ